MEPEDTTADTNRLLPAAGRGDEARYPYPKIERLPVSTLKPAKRNARTHSDKQIAQIAASIEQFGFTNPVLVDEHNRIVAGHGRIVAAKQLGLETIPVIRLEHLSDEELRAYALADNKLALNAGWDPDKPLCMAAGQKSPALPNLICTGRNPSWGSVRGLNGLRSGNYYQSSGLCEY